ncbi:hypothetical protein Sango_0408200 [Sesamum angolense]|uniref:Translocation protein SEC62 n=1 Tax=Sesamum angolense TaxID=2727404 RepID=A0AAE2C407_9LAMI|nr:hypothetical protein Sango_0408200 [Sesamum angolense]
MKKTGGAGGGGGTGGTSGDKKRGRRSSGDTATDAPPRCDVTVLSKPFVLEEKVVDLASTFGDICCKCHLKTLFVCGTVTVKLSLSVVNVDLIFIDQINLTNQGIVSLLWSSSPSVVLRTDQVFSDNDAFFAWTFVKRQPLWQILLSFSWPVVALAICLFPVYPHQVKLLILYFCAGVLLLIFCLLLLRALVFGALWIILGKRIWFFPNILAEEATLKELFQFLPKKDEGARPKWTARLFFALVSMLVILLLRHHAPDEAARARYQKKVSNIIDDVLEWSPRLALSAMMEKQTVLNTTGSGENVTDASNISTQNITQANDGDGGIMPDQYEEEIETVEHPNH